MKKTNCFFLILSIVFSLVGCQSSQEEKYELSNEGTLRDGFVSLKNDHPIDYLKDNNYVIGDNTYSLKKTYNTFHTREPNNISFNYLYGGVSHDFYYIGNFISGLTEYDRYGNIVGDLAIGYKYSKNTDDTETWTFQLRENAEWVNNKNGKKYADVVAEDFVTAFQYAKTNSNLMGYGNIKNVTAVDKYIVEYQVSAGTMLYFLSIPEYLFPVNKTYLEEQGNDFGSDYDHILISGPFRIKEFVQKDHYSLIKNYHYYHRDFVFVNNVNSYFLANKNDHDAPLKLFNNDKTDSFTFNELDEESFRKYVSVNDGTIKQPGNKECVGDCEYFPGSHFMHFNYNRQDFNFECNGFTYTDTIRKETAAAILNTNFRKGFLYGLDAMRFLNARNFDEEWVLRSLNNKGIGEINGRDYIDYFNDYYNQKNNTNISVVGSSGNDPIYNETKARNYFNLAKEELLQEGINGPIYLDVRAAGNSSANNSTKQLLDKIVELSDGFVSINYETPSYDPNKWYGLLDSDLIIFTGVATDYYDPVSTLSYFDGNHINNFESLGLSNYQGMSKFQISKYLPEKYQSLVEDNNYQAANMALRNDVFGQFDEKLEVAKQKSDLANLEERYQLCAEAEYELIYENAAFIPYFTSNEYFASVSRVIPYQKSQKLANGYYKYLAVSKNIINQDDYHAIYQDFISEK